MVTIMDDRTRQMTIESRQLMCIAGIAAAAARRQIDAYDWGGCVPEKLLHWRERMQEIESIARDLAGWT